MEPEPLKKSKIKTPKREISKTAIDPAVAIFTALDDLSRNISELVALTQKNQELLTDILNELEAQDDDGEYLFRQDTATTVLSANIIDMLAIQGFPAKSYILKNDGANTIFVGHNITPSSIDSNIQTASARFYPVLAGEEIRILYNRKKVRNIYIRTAAGVSAYRLWLLW